jgi:hypothetical protein
LASEAKIESGRLSRDRDKRLRAYDAIVRWLAEHIGRERPPDTPPSAVPPKRRFSQSSNHENVVARRRITGTDHSSNNTFSPREIFRRCQ